MVVIGSDAGNEFQSRGPLTENMFTLFARDNAIDKILFLKRVILKTDCTTEKWPHVNITHFTVL